MMFGPTCMFISNVFMIIGMFIDAWSRKEPLLALVLISGIQLISVCIAFLLWSRRWLGAKLDIEEGNVPGRTVLEAPRTIVCPPGQIPGRAFGDRVEDCRTPASNPSCFTLHSL